MFENFRTLILFIAMLVFTKDISGQSIIEFHEFIFNEKGLPVEVQSYLDKKEIQRVSIFWDTSSQKDTTLKIFPFVFLDKNIVAVQVSKYNPQIKDYDFVLIINTTNSITITDTIGPFLDRGITQIALQDITNDGIDEILIKFVEEFGNGLYVFLNRSNNIKTEFESDEQIEITDIDDDNRYEIISFTSLIPSEFGDFYSFPMPTKPNIHSFENGKYIVSNKKYRNYLLRFVPNFLEAIDSLKYSGKVITNITVDERNRLIHKLNKWISDIKEE